VLGSTGSIGRQTLDVASRFPERISVVALTAFASAELIAEQARAFGVGTIALSDPTAAERAAALLPGVTTLAGGTAAERVAALPEVDVVLNALVGAAGLRATLAALSAGKRLALANKESLVTGGELVTSLAAPGRLIPVDSEHSAIFQCLAGEDAEEISRIWLTASGGPFRGWDRARLETATLAEALAHPRWTMGPKITIDSATLMNKGLEAIEAHHLFGVGYDRIRIVVHPQSTIHSMVEFADGSVKAHLGATDMRVPIQYALSHPARWDAPVTPLDFTTAGPLTFEEPDLATFRCLAIALEAGRTGGTMPAALSAANEVAVAAFLAEQCRLTDIARVVEAVVEAHEPEPLASVEQVEAVDAWARERAREALARIG
jgi:1-deoxy-D-xylulose-5-phosphate reductoisomerase